MPCQFSLLGSLTVLACLPRGSLNPSKAAAAARSFADPFVWYSQLSSVQREGSVEMLMQVHPLPSGGVGLVLVCYHVGVWCGRGGLKIMASVKIMSESVCIFVLVCCRYLHECHFARLVRSREPPYRNTHVIEEHSNQRWGPKYFHCNVISPTFIQMA